MIQKGEIEKDGRQVPVINVCFSVPDSPSTPALRQQLEFLQARLLDSGHDRTLSQYIQCLKIKHKYFRTLF